MDALPHDRAARIGTLVALPILALCAWRFAFTCDDAYISFRYARHLAGGEGLVFNLGESPPVEGYSNLGWVLLAALVELVRADVPRAMNAVSLACAAVLVWLSTRAAARLFELSVARACAVAVFLASLAPVGVWATSGLETMPAALAVFATFERLAAARAGPSARGASLAAIAACLLRVDGAAWAALAIGLGFWVARDRDRERAVVAARCALVALACAALAQAAFRLAYHDDLVPNTARVKAGASALRLERGAKYAASFLLDVPALALVPIAAIVSLARTRAPRVASPTGSRTVIAALAFLAADFAFAIWTGGDFLPMGRFFVVAAPFVALLLAAAITRVRSGPATSIAIVAIATGALASFDLALAPKSWRSALAFRWNDPNVQSEVQMWRGARDRAREWRELGRAIAANTRPGESMILGNVGAIGYETELFVHDLFGLVSPEVARLEVPLARRSAGHDKGVAPDFFFDRRPTYLNAYLRRAGENEEKRIPMDWARLILDGRVERDVRALDPSLGFAPGLELVLLRFRWDR